MFPHVQSPTVTVSDVYRVVAPFYDLVSGEWPVYRPGRIAGIEGLGLLPGDTVLDVGCGTGLSLPLLADAVGSTGQIIGLDASAQMLAAAGRRARRSASKVTLIETDTTQADRAALRLYDPDAVLFCYSLSIMRPWRTAWDAVTSTLSPGTRIAIVDLALPTGPNRLLRGLARVACRLGGSDIHARPWRALIRTCEDVRSTTRCGGHVQVWTGTWRPSTVAKRTTIWTDQERHQCTTPGWPALPPEGADPPVRRAPCVPPGEAAPPIRPPSTLGISDFNN